MQRKQRVLMFILCLVTLALIAAPAASYAGQRCHGNSGKTVQVNLANQGNAAIGSGHGGGLTIQGNLASQSNKKIGGGNSFQLNAANQKNLKIGGGNVVQFNGVDQDNTVYGY